MPLGNRLHACGLADLPGVTTSLATACLDLALGSEALDDLLVVG